MKLTEDQVRALMDLKKYGHNEVCRSTPYDKTCDTLEKIGLVSCTRASSHRYDHRYVLTEKEKEFLRELCSPEQIIRDYLKREEP